MIDAQNKLYERATEELLEYCNEILISEMKKKEDNFKDRSLNKVQSIPNQEEDVILFSSIHNIDGRKINRISEIEGNLVLLVNKFEGKLLHLLVNYILSSKEERMREASQNWEDYKYVIRTAVDKWYDNNLNDWKQSSQQIISTENIYSWMNMYKLKINKHNNSVQNADKSNFVYDNNEYKVNKINKFGNVSPPVSKSPLRMEVAEVEVTSSNDPPKTDNSFIFATQSNYDQTKYNPAELSIPTKKQTTRVSLKTTSFYNSQVWLFKLSLEQAEFFKSSET